MAQRDRSQGFGFVYVDIAKLLEERKEGVTSPLPIVSTPDTQVINFAKGDAASQVVSERNELKAEATANANAAQSSQQIRQNLDRLQSLHHKLHAMLEELNHLTKDKKKT